MGQARKKASQRARFAAESANFAKACQAEHRAVGVLLGMIGMITLFPDQREAFEAAEKAHAAVDLALGFVVAAKNGAAAPATCE